MSNATETKMSEKAVIKKMTLKFAEDNEAENATNPVRVITTRNGTTVESRYSDRSVQAALRFYVNAETVTSNFARSLADHSSRVGGGGFSRYKACGLSPEQTCWAHVIVVQTEARLLEEVRKIKAAVAEVVSEFKANRKPIVERLQAARESGVNYPKIRLSTDDGDKVVLSLAGSASRNPGSVSVTDGGPFEQNVYYGRVNVDGTFVAARAFNDKVAAVLDALADDTATAAAIHGKRTGSCSFCGRHLETTESVTAGYGPVCAERYGLPWGKAAAVEAEETVEQCHGVGRDCSNPATDTIGGAPRCADCYEEIRSEMAGYEDDLRAM